MDALPEDVDARVDELYCLPLDRFVPERTALVKALRAEGRRDEAAVVAALAKPAVAAWAVNQVVRSQPKAAQALWAAGDAVLQVQEGVVAGGASGADLRGAIAAQRDALAPLADAARGMVTSRGAFLGEQAVQAVIESLHAAAVDREARPDVERARLARPLRLAGLGALPTGGGRGAPAGWPAPAEEPPSEPAPTEESPPSRPSREEERRAREEERRAAAERRKAQAAAQRALDRAERARDAARDRVERRRDELEAAEEELEAAEEDVRAARDALDG